MCDEDTHTTYSCNIGIIYEEVRGNVTRTVLIFVCSKNMFFVRFVQVTWYGGYHTWVFPIRPCTTEELYFIPCFDGTWYQVQVILILKPGPGTGTCTCTGTTYRNKI